ncbi:hypothetical protein [Paraburkholderia sp. D1E]|uniref:hypothetical protein n=1 Tax=Paraburkholderia sp. D1E TaxID=3461398 RepID=UPI0040463316
MKSKNTVAVALILFVVALSSYANVKLKAANERGEIEIQTCKISITPSARGEIMKPREENDYKFAGYSETLESNGIRQRFGFSIGCADRIADRNDVAKEHGGYFDPERKRWVAYYLDEQDKDSLAPATHIYAIHTSNASGFARTTDDVIGDPRHRARALSYCLFHDHDAKAICGEGQVMNLSDQKANFLPTALKILRSVEFVDVKANDRSASGATTTVAPVGKSTHEK